MRLEWIEDILSVIDTGFFTLVAQKRFLTQSAFTRRIQQGKILDISDKLPSKEVHVKLVRRRNDMSELAEQVWLKLADEYRTDKRAST